MSFTIRKKINILESNLNIKNLSLYDILGSMRITVVSFNAKLSVWQ